MTTPYRLPSSGWRSVARAAALVLACALAACTPMRWERDGFALDTGGEDWQDCRRQAVLGAVRYGLWDPFPRTFIGRDAYGRPFTFHRATPYPNRFLLEQDFLDRCLFNRGYRRVPVAPAPAE